MGLLGSVARGLGEVAGFERSQTYDLKMIVKAHSASGATARAQEILKEQGLHRGSWGAGGHRRMYTEYVAWGYASEVDGYQGFTITHKKSLKQWQKSLSQAGKPTYAPMPFDSAGQIDLFDPRVQKDTFLDGTAWLVNAWLGRQYPGIGPLSL